MKILAIETSCDETALCIADARGGFPNVSLGVSSNIVLSQAKLHEQYGGVFPSVAKREHAKNLIPILKQALRESNFLKEQEQTKKKKTLSSAAVQKVKTILEREPELLEQFLEYIPRIEKPPIDAIAVTYGPGLPPALWVGVNFAKALAAAWSLPLIPVNHMEGHLFSALLEKDGNSKSEFKIQNVEFPVLALLVSGGHTELVLMPDWLEYETIGETRDDAAGEAFDKVARMLGLPYPGGPEVARLADGFHGANEFSLPRPMHDSDSFDFSFSGLKTAVLYRLKKLEGATPQTKAALAHEFQEAVAEILALKTLKAAKKYGSKTILAAGGVSANERIREAMHRLVHGEALACGEPRRTSAAAASELPGVPLLLAPKELTGDNALMIAAAAYARAVLRPGAYTAEEIEADGNTRLGKKNA